MGVHGLWSLLLPIARRVSIETLEGKTLAIDASIWLTQFIKAMRDENGIMMMNAHILGSIRRILKMLFHGIRPVFVFDGATPEIKRREVRERRERRERGDDGVKRTAKRLLVEALKAGNGNLLGGAGKVKVGEGGGGRGTEGEAPGGKADERGAFTAGFVDGNAEDTGEKAGGEVEEKKKDDGNTGDNTNKQNVDDNMDGIFDVDDESDEEPNWEDGNAQGDGVTWETTLPETGDLDMDVVRDLPKDMRKDVVEKAKSRHRINSRKQYMPVAADPSAFSNIQLVNFLKASKMNKSIEKMAKEEVGNMEEGFVMASDRSKIIVQKDRVDKDADFSYMLRGDSSGSSGEEDNGKDEKEKYEGKIKEEKKGEILAKHNSSGSSSEDEDEDENEMASKGAGKKVKNNSSGSSSENDEPQEVVKAAKKPISKQRQRKRYEDDEDDEEEKEEEENDGRIPNPFANKWAEDAQIQSDEQLALSFQREEEESSARTRREENMTENTTENMTIGLTGSGGREDEEEADDEKDEDEEDDDIDWEDGDAVVQGRDEEDNRDSIVLDFSTPQTGYNIFDDPAPPTREEKSNESSGEEITAAQAAAFSEAAADAAKLTSWAGRAVARAIKQHVGSGHLSKEKNGGNGGAEEGGEIGDCGDPQLDLPREPKPRSTIRPNPPSERTEAELNESNRRIELARETLQLQKDLKSADRDDDGITEDMKEDVIKLLQAFGMPYIIAPAEAEAQCCKLEELGLVDGIITQDSDAFVFGGQTIYRNIFDERKFVEVYMASDADKEMGLKKGQFVALAMLLGGDYTPGVSGVGIVNGIEILSAFPMNEDPTNGLKHFKEWMEGFDPLDLVKGNSKVTEGMNEKEIFHQKHKKMRSRWEAPRNFPGPDVLHAYTRPVVDGSAEPFTWGFPEVERLELLCAEKLGWSMEESNRQLGPVLQKMKEPSRQTRLESYFKTYQDKDLGGVIKSKRMADALKRKMGTVPGGKEKGKVKEKGKEKGEEGQNKKAKRQETKEKAVKSMERVADSDESDAGYFSVHDEGEDESDEETE